MTSISNARPQSCSRQCDVGLQLARRFVKLHVRRAASAMRESSSDNFPTLARVALEADNVISEGRAARKYFHAP